MKLAQQLGIDKNIARLMVAQTMLGTAKIILDDERDISELVRFVKSKKGTTEAGLRVAKELGFSSVLKSIVEQAIKRAEEIRKLSEGG